MIPAIQEINFPSYATLHQATVSFTEMGERTISTQVRIDGDVVPDFTGWELSFKGERFILNTKDPQAVKDNSTRNSLVDLTFVSWPVNELKRYFFFEPTSIDASTAIADKYVASVNLPVGDFAALFNKVLKYYFGDKVVFSLYMSGQGQYSTDRALVEINYTYIWDVLVKFFEIYGVRWRIEYDESDDVYTIKAGWPTTDIDINDHDFEYGYKGGLVRFERQVQDVDIHNILLGRGGEKNIPYRYFKRVDPQNPDWAADPDAIPELANIYFDRLRDINFRWYVRGWMQNPNHDTSWEDGGYVYPTYTIASDSPYYFAYQKGLTDEKFNPVEYVRDLPSIEDYGERWGALDDNDDIFPTIQSVSRDPLGRIDETVAVSEIVTDDISAMAQNAAVEKSINRLSVSLNGETRTEFDLQSEEFTIPSGSTGNITYVPFGTDNTYPGLVRFDTDNSTVVAVSDGIEYPIDAIPAGTYRLKLHMVIARSGQATSATGTFGIENIILKTSTQETDAWKPTFDIWVKNIWGTEKQEGETDVQYAERVWLPILGDRVGNEAKIVFSTGFMSVSEDYEFPIVSYPVHDTSKSINGVPSEWRITLRKSDAEFDATGLYIPNASTGGKPVAGDKFFFIGIDMPFRYVELAEEDLNTNKEAQLDTEATISPTWIMNLDKVRVHTLEDQEYGQTLADRLAAGGKVWIKDRRFTPGQRLQLYVQSITYTWNEPSDDSPYIVPDIEVVLSDKVVAVDSVVQRIQNDVSSIKNQYARISDVEAVVRSVAEPIFLKKTGESDSSDSPTQFSSKVTSKGFRQGAIGGTGWGIYRDNTSAFAADENEQPVQTRGTRSLRALRANVPEQEEEADAVIEADRIVVRKELQVNSLVINQIAYVGGKEIISAAKIEVSKVIETANGYICYFDQRRNSVANNFAVNDIAFGQVFNPDNTEQRYYKMVVTATDVDCITLGKSPKDGSGVPKVGDIIVQYGNTTNVDRQYVIVRDVIGGGYERMLSGLNSVSSTGKEYYFAGRQNNSGARWFVGDSLGDYAEYEDGVLTIKANVIFKAGQEIPGLSALETQVDNLEYLHTALPKSDTIISGGLILSKVIALRDSNSAIKSGINGDPTLSSIAAWYGGPMADKEATPTPASYAQSLFRFDGSGYLAGGNIGWENDGDGHIPGISWETTGGVTSVTIGANVKLEQTGGTDSSVTDLVTAVQSFPSTYLSKTDAAELYHPLGGSTTLVSFKIGGATLTWHPQVGSTPGYIELDSAFVTNGDQIVIDGAPQGGGGGGGATMLRQLDDVYHNATSVLRKNGGSVANGDLLSFDSTGNRWVALDQSTIAPDLSNYYTKSQTDTEISTAITALNLGAAATYGVGSVASGNTGLVTGGAVWTAIDNLPEPMVFKGSLGTGGTISSLPVNGTAQVGDTYKVITAGTYAGQAAKVGDTFICQTKTASANTWVLIPSGDEPEGTVTSVGLTMPTGFSVGSSPITSSGTLAVTFASGYSLPTTAKQTNWDAVYGYFTNGILPYNHGGTGISSYTKGNLIYASANNTLAKLAPNTGAKQFLTMTSSVPSWGSLAFSDLPNLYLGTTQIQSSSAAQSVTGVINLTMSGELKIGTAKIWWDSEKSALRIDQPLITGGDQIVIDGTPGGGGGGGGATTLAGLDDTNITNPQAGQMLSWNGTKWVNTNAPTGSITSVALAAGASNGTLHLVVNGTAQSDVAVTGLGSLAYKSSLAASDIPDLSATYQPKDSDLTNIASLTGAGFLKRASNGTWSLDGNTYLTGITSTMVTNALGYTPANSTALANYLPLAGGTLTNSEREILKLNQETTSTGIVGPYIRFSLNNGIRAGVGYNSSIGAFIENYFTVDGVGSNAYVNLDNSGVLKHNNTQPYLHTGNYSSYLDSVYHPYGGGNIAFQTSTLAASGQVTITGNWAGQNSGLAVTNNNTTSSSPWLITAYAPNVAEGHYGGSIIFGKANSSYNTGVIDFYYAGNGSTSNYVGVGLFYKDDLLKVYGTGVTEVKSLKIGSATITWNSNGYLHIDQPLVTAGDQIVISGTPGGGGGGGATSLWGLDDVSVPHGSSTPSNGQVLTWNSTLAKWTNQSITSGVSSVVGQTGAVTTAQIATALTGAGYKLTDTTYSAGTGLTLNGTQFSVAANTYAPYNSNGYLPLNGGTLKNSARSFFVLNQETTSTGTTGPYIEFRVNNTINATIGYNSNVGTFLQAGTGSYAPLINIDTTGVLKLNNNQTFLHSGNYTDYVNTTNYPGLMGNQTITLSGDVSGSGATSITTTIGEGKVTNAMLAGSIENSKLNTIGVSKGGTGLTTWTGAYRLVYSTAATTLTTLAPNSTTTRKFLRQVGANNAATAPAWDTVTKTDVGLSNVENTALSTWAGTTNITTLGTITTGVWHGSAIGNSYLANSSITINGSSTSLGGSFSTASITAGTAGQSTESSGVSFFVPYVTMNAYGIVTAYGTHTHTISASDLTTTIGSTTYAAYHAAGYVKKDGDTMTSSARDILTLNQNTTSTGVVGPFLLLKVNGASVAGVGSNSSVGVYLENDNANGYPYVNLDNNGVFKYNNTYTFWHSGNSNLSTVPWACSTLTASGNGTFAGNVGIGTPSPGSKLEVLNSGDPGTAGHITAQFLSYSPSPFGIVLRGYSSGAHAIQVERKGTSSEFFPLILQNRGGNVGIGTTSLVSGARLTVSGIIASSGDQVVSSDLTLKTNLTPVTYSVSDIAKARAVEFDWKDGRGHSMGSIAQDWLGIAPALVHGEEGNMSLAYGQLALVNTILLARQSESHEERIKELEARVAELEMENERLRMN